MQTNSIHITVSRVHPTLAAAQDDLSRGAIMPPAGPPGGALLVDRLSTSPPPSWIQRCLPRNQAPCCKGSTAVHEPILWRGCDLPVASCHRELERIVHRLHTCLPGGRVADHNPLTRSRTCEASGSFGACPYCCDSVHRHDLLNAEHALDWNAIPGCTFEPSPYRMDELPHRRGDPRLGIYGILDGGHQDYAGASQTQSMASTRHTWHIVSRSTPFTVCLQRGPQFARLIYVWLKSVFECFEHLLCRALWTCRKMTAELGSRVLFPTPPTRNLEWWTPSGMFWFLHYFSLRQKLVAVNGNLSMRRG